MIAFDTNLLVRYVMADDAAQAQRVDDLLERTQAAGETVLVVDTVLCELVWVLKDCYGLQRHEIVAALARITNLTVFDFQERTRVLASLADYTSGPADFADYLIGRAALSHGASTTYSFDRKLRGHKCFTLAR